VCNEKINTLCSEIERLNKLQVMAQRAVQDLKLSIKPSYANKASPLRTPEYLNNSSVSVTEHEKNSNQSRFTEQSDPQIGRSEYNKLRNHDNETGLTDNVLNIYLHTINLKTFTVTTMNTKYPYEFKELQKT
jgi:hypothetical protein